MTASLGQEGPKDRLDMASRQPLWARDGFKTANLECFTDHTLAHPLNCRGGVVARLSA